MQLLSPKTAAISLAAISVVSISGIALASHHQPAKHLDHTYTHTTAPNTSTVLGDNTTSTTTPTQTDTTTPTTQPDTSTASPSSTITLSAPVTPTPTIPSPTTPPPTPTQPVTPPVPTCDTTAEAQDQSEYEATYNQDRTTALYQINLTGYSPPFVSAAAIAAVTPIEQGFRTEVTNLQIQWGNAMFAIHCDQSPPFPTDGGLFN